MVPMQLLKVQDPFRCGIQIVQLAVWFFLIGWPKIARVAHHCGIQMMTNIASEQLDEEINAVSAIQMRWASWSDKRVQLLLF